MMHCWALKLRKTWELSGLNEEAFVAVVACGWTWRLLCMRFKTMVGCAGSQERGWLTERGVNDLNGDV